MVDVLLTIFRQSCAACLLAMLSWLVAGLFVRPSRLHRLAFASLGFLTLPSVILIALHLLRIPITSAALWLTLSAGTLLAAGAAFMRKGGQREPTHEDTLELRVLLPFILILLVILFPFTPLTGIDTYKWQDVASTVGMEKRIAWMIHPLSLLGFTPRAYPCIQPLALALIQIMGGFNLEISFYILSLVSSCAGLLGAFLLGKKIFARPLDARLFAVLYVFSPVFLRYNHWVIGRGVFLAILPFLLLALTGWPRVRAIIWTFFVLLLLLASHKTGIAAVLLLTAALPFWLLLPHRENRPVVWLCAMASLGLALALSMRGSFAPASVLKVFIYQSATRFGWHIPAAAAGIWLFRGWLDQPAWRRFFPMLCLTLPLAYAREMYGALLALPFVAMAATIGVTTAMERWPAWQSRILWLVVILTTSGTLVIVGQRSFTAMSRDVRTAALFLNQYDPQGPLMIEAPGINRRYMQAYVAGCPRFSITAADTSVRIARPPAYRGDLHQLVQDMVKYLRNFMSLEDLRTDWYGVNPRLYYVVIDGTGMRPGGTRCIYNHAKIQIYAPDGQTVPP